jgi:hypothetical protein
LARRAEAVLGDGVGQIEKKVLHDQGQRKPQRNATKQTINKQQTNNKQTTNKQQTNNKQRCAGQFSFI